MAGSSIRTPSRPDLNSIFNTRQRKPRSTQSKNANAKQQIAIVQGDLVQLYAAKIEQKQIHNRADAVLVKRSRSPQGADERITRRRVDLESSEEHCSTLSNSKDIDQTTSGLREIVVLPERDNLVVNIAKDGVLELNKLPINLNSDEPTITAPLEQIYNPVIKISEPFKRTETESASVGRAVKLTRAQLLMKSALAPDRAPKFQDIPKIRNISSAGSQIKNAEPETVEIVSTSDIAKVRDDWVSTANRLLTPELHIPVRLQNLKEIFKAVETTMNVHKARRRISVPLPELSSGVESIVKKTFTKSYLAQIVHLFPEGYSLHNRSIRDSESGRNENVIMVTMVELPGSSSLNQLQRNQHRLDRFHDCLLKFVFRFYLQWLKTKYPEHYNEVESSGLYHLKSWHSAFPVERCPAVPLCQLPVPPASASSNELARLVGEGDAKQKVAAEHESKAKALPAEGISNTDIPEGLQGLPLSLIQKIRSKEAAARKLTEEIGTKQQIQADIDLDSLPNFVVLVHGMFSALGRPSMLFSAFIAQLKFKLKQQFVSEGSILNRVNLLLELLPSFCQKVADGRIEAFRIDLSANIGHLRSELRYKINQSKSKRNSKV